MVPKFRKKIKDARFQIKLKDYFPELCNGSGNSERPFLNPKETELDQEETDTGLLDSYWMSDFVGSAICSNVAHFGSICLHATDMLRNFMRFDVVPVQSRIK